MAKLEVRTKENPRLHQRELTDGRISLYLEYYLGRTSERDPETGKEINVKHNRKKENLNLYLTSNPKSPIERNLNKETLELAKKIRFEREQDFKNQTLGYRLKKSKINFIDYYRDFIEGYTKKDIRVLKSALTEFVTFIKNEYPAYGENIKPVYLTSELMTEFVEYLQKTHEGEGARTYYMRFKKVAKQAFKDGILKTNPCEDVSCKIDDQVLRKDVLSMDEVRKLIETHYQGENPEIRRAFTFTLYTGVRLVDTRELTYGNIDYSNKRLSFEQAKTTGRSKASGVIIPLNNALLSLIGNPPMDNEGSPKFDTKIFTLPSHAMLNKALKHWVNKAKINKHITWHCGRHTFAVNILNAGANIKTVASLLGHSGLKHTEKYTRAVDELKEKAINSLFE
ncbi:MAG: site-specific integrase [Spirochaetes bacterium]|nr:site-specific integrase [Spirochaetota bacterium]